VYYKIDKGGYDRAIGQWNEAVSKANEKKRLDELALTRKNEGIDREFTKLVQARVAADNRSANSLQRLNAALAAGSGDGADTATTCRADDPRDAIIGECASTLGQVDKAARRLAEEKGALQRYASEVCVK
jgi:hypothetical protein